MQYLVIQRIWHSKLLRHVEPGDVVSLEHLAPEAVAKLVQLNVVMSAGDEPGESSPSFVDRADNGLQGAPVPAMPHVTEPAHVADPQEPGQPDPASTPPVTSRSGKKG